MHTGRCKRPWTAIGLLSARSRASAATPTAQHPGPGIPPAAEGARRAGHWRERHRKLVRHWPLWKPEPMLRWSPGAAKCKPGGPQRKPGGPQRKPGGPQRKPSSPAGRSVDQVDDDRLRGTAGADRGNGLVPPHAHACGVARAARLGGGADAILGGRDDCGCLYHAAGRLALSSRMSSRRPRSPAAPATASPSCSASTPTASTARPPPPTSASTKPSTTMTASKDGALPLTARGRLRTPCPASAILPNCAQARSLTRRSARRRDGRLSLQLGRRVTEAMDPA